MKKLLSVLFAAALLSEAVPVGAAPVIYERQEVETYIGDSAEPVAFECLFRSDLPQVPWIDAETYLGCTHDSGISTRDNGDGPAAAVKIAFRMLRGGRSIPWGCGGRYPQPKGSLPSA